MKWAYAKFLIIDASKATTKVSEELLASSVSPLERTKLPIEDDNEESREPSDKFIQTSPAQFPEGEEASESSEYHIGPYTTVEQEETTIRPFESSQRFLETSEKSASSNGIKMRR